MNTSAPICIQIIGAPVACSEGTHERWQSLALWLGGKLRMRFGDAIVVDYYNLFDPGCPAMPADAQLPLVLVDGVVLTSGGKISMPLIRQHIETLLASPSANR